MIEDEAWVTFRLDKVVVSGSANHRNIGLNNLIHQRLTSNWFDEALTAIWNVNSFLRSQVL